MESDCLTPHFLPKASLWDTFSQRDAFGTLLTIAQLRNPNLNWLAPFAGFGLGSNRFDAEKFSRA